MALVLLAAGRSPVREEQTPDERSQRTRITLTSKYDLDETVRQVERSVRRSGLPVLAKAVPRMPEGDAARAQAAHVLVLGDDAGRTPIVQADAHTAPELPWQVLIRQRPDGRTEVSLPLMGTVPLPDEVPPETLARVTALPQVLRSVIT